MKSLKDSLEEFGIFNYKQNHDGSIDIFQKVQIHHPLEKIPYKINICHNSFSVYNSGLKTLENCPEVIKGHFNCSFCNLTSLDFHPKSVSGVVDASWNKISKISSLPNEFVFLDLRSNQLEDPKFFKQYIKKRNDDLASISNPESNIDLTGNPLSIENIIYSLENGIFDYRQVKIVADRSSKDIVLKQLIAKLKIEKAI